MKKFTIITFTAILAVLHAVSASGQVFKFSQLESSVGCTSGFYTLNTQLTITGILVKDIYYDDPVSNQGSFSFEVLFSYENDFGGTLPVNPDYFWTYQVKFTSSNTQIHPNSATNNLSDVPIATNTETFLNLKNNNSYHGSASNMGLHSHTYYTDPEILELFAFEEATLTVNLPCLYASSSVFESSPLSVSLGELNASANHNNTVDIDWTTVSEENVLGFEIEKSADSRQWQSIGYVVSLANDGLSHQPIYYHMIDPVPVTGKQYYRLKMIDRDGSYTYSHIVKVYREADNADLVIYPNPAKDLIQFSNLFSSGKLEVYNMTGQLVYSEIYTDQIKVSKMDISYLGIGQYIIKNTSQQGLLRISRFEVKKYIYKSRHSLKPDDLKDCQVFFLK